MGDAEPPRGRARLLGLGLPLGRGLRLRLRPPQPRDPGGRSPKLWALLLYGVDYRALRWIYFLGQLRYLGSDLGVKMMATA